MKNFQIQKKHNQELLVGYDFWILTHTENGLAYKTDPRFIVYIGTTYEKKEIFKSLWNWSRLCIDRRIFF